MVKNKLFHLASPTIKTPTKTFSEPSWIRGQHIPHLGVLLLPKHQVTWKAASFEWGLEHEKALQQAQEAVRAASPLGPYDPGEPAVLKVSVADGDAA